MSARISSDSPLSSLLQGLQRGLQNISESAEKVASFGSERGGESGELSSVIVDLKAEMRGVEAILKTIKVTQEMEEEVLNIIA